MVKYKCKSALLSAVALLFTVLVAMTGCTAAADQKAEVIPTEPTPIAMDAVPEVILSPIPYDYFPLASYTVDYSTIADDTARVNNIQKAASQLNGEVIEFDDFNGNINRFGLMFRLGDITSYNGWQTAGWYNWDDIAWNEIESANETDRQEVIQTIIKNTSLYEKTSELGGGIDIVAAAVWCGASDAGLNREVDFPDTFYNIDGDMHITNSIYEDGVLLCVKTENNTVTASFYALDKPEPMSSFTLDAIHQPHYFTHFPDVNNYSVNIRKAAEMVNGTVIKPGETMSLNDILGPRTAENKWLALIKINTNVKEFGCGVSEVATALYNAAIRAELEIVNHTLSPTPSDLVDVGLDAEINMSGADLRIYNPYDSDVTIEAEVLDHLNIVINIYGPPMAYKVDYYSEKTEDESDKLVYEYSDGKSPVAYTIYKVSYDVDGKETMREIYAMLSYSPVEGIKYVKGPDHATDPTDSAKPKQSSAPVPTAKP